MALKQYNRAEVGTNGLACPFAKSDAERYMNIVVCKPSEGFKEPRLLLYVKPRPPLREGHRPRPRVNN